MILTVRNYLRSAKDELRVWEEEKVNPKNDDTIPENCYRALIDKKIKTFKEVVSYLEELPIDAVLTTQTGRTEEGEKYYDMVNRL